MTESGRGSPPRPVRLWRRDPNVLRYRVPPGTWRRVVRFTKPYRPTLWLFGVVVVVDAVAVAAGPMLFRSIIDDGIAHDRTGLIVGLAIVVAALAVLDATLTLVQRLITAQVGEGLIRDMRNQVFDHVQRMPLAFFTRTQTGSLVSRLQSDVVGARTAFTDLMSNVVGSAVLAALVLGAMVTISWPITLLAIVVLPVLGIPARIVGRRLAELTHERFTVNSAITTTMTERFNVSGALLVKLMGEPQRESAEFAGRTGRLRDVGVRIAVIGRVFFIALTLAAALATALVYGWGGVMSAHGGLKVGAVVALAAYLGRLYGPLSSLSGAHIDVMTALVSFDRVFEVLDLEPAIAEAPGAVDLARGPASVVFDDVVFSYPSATGVSLASLEAVVELDDREVEPTLRNVSFEARPGELLALVGPSGAGKTTIGMLVARLYDVSGGSVRIDGVDVREASLASLRAKVGVVTQDPHLFHDSVRNNLLYAKADAADDELWAALRDAQVADLVASLPDGLDTVVGDRGYRLSGGEKQRVAIARLLLRAPDIVVLDEATAHLDNASETAVHEALQTALAGRTALVIAHRLSTVQRADCLLVVDRGRIVERGTHAELLAAGGLYTALYRTQFATQRGGLAGDDEPKAPMEQRADGHARAVEADELEPLGWTLS